MGIMAGIAWVMYNKYCEEDAFWFDCVVRRSVIGAFWAWLRNTP